MPPVTFGFTPATWRPYDAPLLREMDGDTVRTDQNVRFGIGRHPGDPSRGCGAGGGRRWRCPSGADQTRVPYNDNHKRLATVKAPTALPISSASTQTSSPLTYRGPGPGPRSALHPGNTRVAPSAVTGRFGAEVPDEPHPETRDRYRHRRAGEHRGVSHWVQGQTVVLTRDEARQGSEALRTAALTAEAGCCG